MGRPFSKGKKSKGPHGICQGRPAGCHRGSREVSDSEAICQKVVEQEKMVKLVLVKRETMKLSKAKEIMLEAAAALKACKDETKRKVEHLRLQKVMQKAAKTY